ncbi:MAG: LON peptidase substrate-binding domain-containing protein [Methylovulum sp.]|uniref:LON peptidase substrate-binding domain-containing protein n=1 Tax=Methylovulum sp. TaxID=1916980 RepID=UPI00262C57FF|nr:LON peptidase substrate-binding domain-containing protein [Methylovulum sp.]MDD2725635.1 LON peptidase substrate-binding domain-containing protein [Methylovulum sp.]MDD5125943.1 LON peptidase substrate-binding domain-containing protein [Methylovulum sp.]
MKIKDIKNLLLGPTADNEEPSTEIKPEASLPLPALPDNALIIVPMRDTVLFPKNVSPLVIGRKSSIAAVQQAVRSEQPVGLLMQRHDIEQDPSAVKWPPKPRQKTPVLR